MARLTFLGTGTSQGVPVIACDCQTCQSKNPKDKRLRSSVLLEIEGTNIVIDSGPDFRQQMLRADVKHLDAILYTHGHKDHIAGLDDIRAYNYFQNAPIDLYMDEQTEENIRMEFSYIFREDSYPGIPEVRLHRVHAFDNFKIGNIDIRPIEALHYKLPVIGYRIGNISYVTDANYLPEASLAVLKNSEVLVLNALRHEKHISHFTLEEAKEVAQIVGAKKTYFTHISHQLGKHEDVNLTLGSNMELSYDGLTLHVD